MSDQATFRGVSFLVDVTELEGGRATVAHAYPLRDVNFVEDLGRRGRVFTVDGFVLGADAQARKEALLSALEEEGPGELVHPRFGTRRVAISSFRVRERQTETRIVRFSFDCEETETAPPFPKASPAPDGKVGKVTYDGDVAVAAIRARLSAAKQVSLPASMLASVSSTISEASVSLMTKLGPLVSGAQELASLQRKLVAISQDADDLARAPLAAWERFTAAFLSFGDVTLPSFVYALLEAAAFAPTAPPPPTTTPKRQAQRELYDLTLWAIRTAEVAQAAVITPGLTFETYDEAVALRGAVIAQLDEQAEASDDSTFDALQQLRSDLVSAVPGAASDLPRLSSYTPAAQVPSLVLAHRLYGDVSMEADIVARNRIQRPGFMRGGVELEVLSRG